MANNAPASTLEIRRLDAPGAAQLQALCDVLVDCVEGGASVSFMLPLTRAKALAPAAAAAPAGSTSPSATPSAR